MAARHPARDFPGFTPELPNFRKWNPPPYAQGLKLREAKLTEMQPEQSWVLNSILSHPVALALYFMDVVAKAWS